MKRVKNFKEWACPPAGWNYLPALIATTVTLWIVMAVMLYYMGRYDMVLIARW